MDRLGRPHPVAAGSLREGLEEMLTVMRLAVGLALMRTLRSTNPIERIIAMWRSKSRNVKRWRDGKMAMRWAAEGMLEAQKQFHRVMGHRDIAQPVAALRHHADAVTVDKRTQAA